MATLKPKEFIKAVLIDELGILTETNPYISFIMMGIGIEFLGKCINSTLNGWNIKNRSKEDFEKATTDIPKFTKVHTLLDNLRIVRFV